MFSTILETFFVQKKSTENHLIGFEDVLKFIKIRKNRDLVNKNHRKYVIINTLPANEQNLLIEETLLESTEEKTINQFIEDYEMEDVNIIVYGKNSADGSVWEKHRQLLKLGFREIYIYSGGLFEWLLLQETYGVNEFPTTAKCGDILHYRALPHCIKN